MPELSKIRNTQTGIDYDIADLQARSDIILRNVYHVSGTIPAGSGKTFQTSSSSTYRINSNMRVINCVFGTPSNVTSIVSWSTATDAIQFSGTFAGQTNIDFDLVETKTMTVS